MTRFTTWDTYPVRLWNARVGVCAILGSSRACRSDLLRVPSPGCLLVLDTSFPGAGRARLQWGSLTCQLRSPASFRLSPLFPQQRKDQFKLHFVKFVPDRKPVPTVPCTGLFWLAGAGHGYPYTLRMLQNVQNNHQNSCTLNKGAPTPENFPFLCHKIQSLTHSKLRVRPEWLFCHPRKHPQSTRTVQTGGGLELTDRPGICTALFVPLGYVPGYQTITQQKRERIRI